MSVRMVGSSWQAYVTGPGGKRYRKNFSEKIEAEAWELETKLNVKRGVAVTEGRTAKGTMTLKIAFDKVWKAKWKGKPCEKSALVNSQSCIDFFGKDMTVAAVTTDDIENFKDYLARTNSNSTINKKISALSMALKHAVKLGAIQNLPSLDRLSDTSTRPRFVPEEDIDRLILRAEMLGYYDIADAIVIACRTGLRQGELLGLVSESPDWSENFVDSDSKELVIVNTKNGKLHKAPMPKRVVTVVERRLKELEKPGKLFPFNKHKLTYLFKKVCVIEGIEMRWHDLRHCFCSWHVQKGTPIEAISRMANHSDISVTMRYAYLSTSNYHDYARQLD